MFETKLLKLKEEIREAEDLDELEYLRKTNEKKYWWSSIFLHGLFYGLNDEVGHMIMTWIFSALTFGIYGLYVIYTSHRDETEFNNQMEYYILQKTKELKNNELKAIAEGKRCKECNTILGGDENFCQKCGAKIE